jgi:hypothetical protein
MAGGAAGAAGDEGILREENNPGLLIAKATARSTISDEQSRPGKRGMKPGLTYESIGDV